MKRFHLFAGSRYYPGGGAEDYLASYDTLESAMEAYDQEPFESLICDRDWCNVMETTPDGSLHRVARATLDWDTKAIKWEIQASYAKS